MPNETILYEIIRAYREIIKERYQYERLQQHFTIPDSINEEQIATLRNYFLTYIYPGLEKRKQLNEAFESLDSYIKNPRKLLQILVDSTSLILKYGRHLPKILKSGIKALRSFRDASKFERLLVAQAVKTKKELPYTQEAIFNFIKEIPRHEIDKFIEGTQSLFQILHDRKQVQKIIEIVAFLIAKMKQHPNNYSDEEVKGLEIGHELIEKGNILFENLGKKNQEQLIDFIVRVETETLDKIFQKGDQD